MYPCAQVQTMRPRIVQLFKQPPPAHHQCATPRPHCPAGAPLLPFLPAPLNLHHHLHRMAKMARHLPQWITVDHTVMHTVEHTKEHTVWPAAMSSAKRGTGRRSTWCSHCSVVSLLVRGIRPRSSQPSGPGWRRTSRLLTCLVKYRVASIPGITGVQTGIPG